MSSSSHLSAVLRSPCGRDDSERRLGRYEPATPAPHGGGPPAGVAVAGVGPRGRPRGVGFHGSARLGWQATDTEPASTPDHSPGTRTVRGLTLHHPGGCGLSEEACQAGLRCKRREVPVSATSTSRRLAGSASPWPPWDSATDAAPRRRVAVGAIGAVVVAPRSRRPPGAGVDAAVCGHVRRRGSTGAGRRRHAGHGRGRRLLDSPARRPVRGRASRGRRWNVAAAVRVSGVSTSMTTDTVLRRSRALPAVPHRTGAWGRGTERR